MSTALAIFVKTPGLSPIKTRLAATIGTADAEQFHTLAATAVAQVAFDEMPEIHAYWAIAEAAGMDHVQWQQLPRIWQGDGGLGARLHRVCSQLLAAHDRVLLVGADAPQLSVALLRRAVAALADPATPFVLGRADDGGFWLFGTRAPVPIEVWGTPRYSMQETASELMDALSPHGAIAQLPVLNDLDDAGDAHAVIAALLALPAALPAQRALSDWLQTRFIRAGSKPLRA
ncbi:MAG: DUF2064 domain-containing protein [Rudaea sp.]